jgi:hypothetical protein
MTLGHLFLNSQFGEKAIPTIGWQIGNEGFLSLSHSLSFSLPLSLSPLFFWRQTPHEFKLFGYVETRSGILRVKRVFLPKWDSTDFSLLELIIKIIFIAL